MGIPTPTTFPPGPSWIVINYDNPISFPVWGQFDPKIQEDRGKPIWETKPGILGTLPWMKFIGTGLQGITFEFMALGTTILDPYPLVAWFRLHELSLPDPSLGRPPIILFNHGPMVYRGFITEVPEAPMEYWGGNDFIRSRIVRQIGPVRIRLTRIPDVPFQIDPFTSVVAFTEETNFEELAKQHYSDARFGPSLEQWNQGKKIGDQVEIPRLSSGVVDKTPTLAPFFGDSIEGL